MKRPMRSLARNCPMRRHPRLDDATREALVRHADGSIGRLAALLTAAQDMPGGRDTCRPARPTQARKHTDDRRNCAARNARIRPNHPANVRYRPSPVAVSPPVEHARNAARWPTVVRHVTAGALMLTVVGAIAYWQLTVHAGQIQRAANSVAPAPAASSGVGDVAQPAQEPSSASNAAIDDTAATEPPAQASPPLAGPPPSTSGPLHPSIQPALTAPLFRAFATDDADQPPAAMAAELSVAPSDDPDAVWLVLDSVSADLLLSLASAPAEQPRQSPTIGEPAAGTEPAAPQAQTAAVPGQTIRGRPDTYRHANLAAGGGQCFGCRARIPGPWGEHPAQSRRTPGSGCCRPGQTLRRPGTRRHANPAAGGGQCVGCRARIPGPWGEYPAQPRGTPGSGCCRPGQTLRRPGTYRHANPAAGGGQCVGCRACFLGPWHEHPVHPRRTPGSGCCRPGQTLRRPGTHRHANPAAGGGQCVGCRACFLGPWHEHPVQPRRTPGSGCCRPGQTLRRPGTHRHANPAAGGGQCVGCRACIPGPWGEHPAQPGGCRPPRAQR